MARRNNYDADMAYPKATLRIEFGPEQRIGPGKVRLLELVADTGSISAAAREMDMSYRRAWLLIDEMNRMFKEPVIAAAAGGAHGGGAELTGLGRNVIATYRAIEADSTEILGKRLGQVLGQVTMAPPSAGRRSRRT
jgi:molybdate transport system regulatory protein